MSQAKARESGVRSTSKGARRNVMAHLGVWAVAISDSLSCMPNAAHLSMSDSGKWIMV